MIRPLLRIGGLIAFVTLLSPAIPQAAPPPGLQYDEIVRIVINGTPPPPGSFQTDVAAINAATPAPAAPRRRGFGGLSSIAGAVLSGNANAVGGAVTDAAIDNALQNALSGTFSGLAASMNAFMRPHIFRYAYWNGWERIDDLGSQTATIRKCELGQVVHLDLAHKTYTIVTPQVDVAQSVPTPQARTRNTGTPAPPGTAVVSLNSTTRALGTQRIEGQSVAGFDATTTLAMTQATGSCRNGSTSFHSVEYVSPVGRPPVNLCPLRGRPVPEAPADMVAQPGQGGCRPTFSMHTSGPPLPQGKLSLYTFMQLSGAAGATPPPSGTGVGFLTERGNLKMLGAADGPGLFAIPSDFTKSS